MTAAEILKARARVLRRPPSTGTTAPSLQVVEFHLANERYAIEQARVREVLLLKDLTPLPCTPAFVRGIVNIRGQIVPVIDFRKFFDLPEAGITDVHMIVIIHGHGIELGIEADVVTGARAIALDCIQPSLQTLTGIRSQYLRGVTDDHVVILDAAKILNDSRIVVDEEVQALGIKNGETP